MIQIYRDEDCRFDVDGELLIQRLGEVLDGESLLVEREDLKPYECDGMSGYRVLPKVAVIPHTIDQVHRILAICHDLDVPVVTRGAGTSLSAGSLPHPQGVLLSMAKFNRILEVDPDRRLARVEPGVRNLAVSEAAAPHGLYYAPDPSSQIACSIGGNVAENAGGVHCLKYGLTVHNVLSATMITIDGDVVTLGGEALDAPGGAPSTAPRACSASSPTSPSSCCRILRCAACCSPPSMTWRRPATQLLPSSPPASSRRAWR